MGLYDAFDTKWPDISTSVEDDDCLLGVVAHRCASAWGIRQWMTTSASRRERPSSARSRRWLRGLLRWTACRGPGNSRCCSHCRPATTWAGWGAPRYRPCWRRCRSRGGSAPPPLRRHVRVEVHPLAHGRLERRHVPSKELTGRRRAPSFMSVVASALDSGLGGVDSAASAAGRSPATQIPRCNDVMSD